VKVPGGRALVVLVATKVSLAAMNELIELGVDQLEQKQKELRAKKDFMAAILIQFRIDLDKGEQEKVLLRSMR
jgi:hypothetical protein